MKIPLLQDLEREYVFKPFERANLRYKVNCLGYLEEICSEMHVSKCMLNFDLREEVTLEVLT